jgi:gamma-glutamylcyclotransferase (GGCT)/AIG2-like uncharacterized protein YtfP
MTQYVFAYGTLRLEKIRNELLGYGTSSLPAQLKGFSMGSIILDNIKYPIIMENPDSYDIIEGEYFAVEELDLEKLDNYESAAYRRKVVTLENGIMAWVYIQ